MMLSRFCLPGTLVFLCLVLPVTSSADGPAHKSLPSIPLTFERNQGQSDARYKFLSRHQGVEGQFSAAGPDFLVPYGSGAHRIQMRFRNASQSIAVEGIRSLPGRANYLRGNDPSKWISDIPTYGEILYRSLYPGIDLSFHGQEGKAQLEHDFLIAPHADPGVIAFGFGNDETMRIDRAGQLVIGRGDHVLTFERPQAWQETATGAIPVDASFVKRGPHSVGFRVFKYDASQPLIIDPVLSFATYLDGTSGDNITDVATDPSGDVYVTGWTYSADFPTAAAKQSTLASAPDAFVAKLDPTLHTLLFSTYLGGTNTDLGQSIAVDASGNVAISGVSSSRDFPHAGKLSSTIDTYTTTYNFLASLTSNGSALRYSGFIGSTFGGFDDFNPRQNRVVFDPNGYVYMAGLTQDPNYPYTSGAYGGLPASYPADETLFVLKAGPDGTIVYGATIPETPQQQNLGVGQRIDLGGLAVDASGEVFLGGTTGNMLPVTSGVLQSTFPNNVNGYAGYALKLNAAGSALIFSTYLPGVDAVEGLALDGSNNVYLSGGTLETNLPTQPNAFMPTFGNIATCDCWDGFIFKLSSDGSQALAATYYNGVATNTSYFSAPSTVLRDIKVDSLGNVAVGGLTGAPNLPLKNPIIAPYSSLGLYTINDSLIMARFSSNLSTLQFGSFLSAIDNSASYEALALDPQDRLIVAGSIQSKLFPTTPGAFQSVAPNANTLLNYQFIADFDLSVPGPSLCLDSTAVTFGIVPVGSSSQSSINVTNCGNAALTLSSVQSSSPLVTTTNNCSAVAPGSACKLNLTFTPTGVEQTNGTLTIAGNMAVSPQDASFTGSGGVPSVFLPNSITFSDLLVGETGSTGALGIFNNGGAPFVLSSVTITGDFQINDNGCTSPVPARGSCQIQINFSPTGVGTRTGTLILQDNLTPTTQTIQLSGNGLTTAPVPTITNVQSVPQITSGVGQVIISGTGFFPNSVVYWNGVAKTTYYGAETVIVAQLSAADLSQVGESSVYVTTPAPGGGTSNTFQVVVYGRMQMQVLHTVYNPVTSKLYATIGSGSTQNANSLVEIDPVSMQVTRTLLSGGKPDALALSDDGTMLYVGQDDLHSVAQISLPSGVANFTAQLPQGSDPFLSSNGVEASAIIVVPGKPHTWIAGICYIGVSPCGGGAVIYDDATMRPTFAQSTQLTANSFAFVNDPNTVYSTEFNQSPPDVSSYSISSSGITYTATSTWAAAAGGTTLVSDGTELYAANGQVIDPSNLTVKYKLQQGGSAIAVDKTNSRIFYSGTLYGGYYSGYYGALSLTAVDAASLSTIGTIGFQEYGSAVEIQRFGTKGVVINAGNELIFLQTSLANSASTPPQVTVTPKSLSFGSQNQNSTSAAQTVTLKNGSSVPLNISNIGVNSSGYQSTDFASTNSCPTTLAAGSLCNISVTFVPTNVGYETGQLTINDDASTGSQIVPLDGTGVAVTYRYSATATPASLTFGTRTIGSTSNAQTVTLSNTGTGALSINNVIATGDFAQSNNCGNSLAAGASCAINVTFTPMAAGSRSGQIMISDNATAGYQFVALEGTGAAVPLTYSATATPSSLTFASQGAGSISTAQVVTLSNTGTGTIEVSGISMTGDFVQSNNCPTLVAPGNACTITINFEPTATGSRTGLLTIADNATLGSQTVSLSGTGESPISFAPSGSGGSSATVTAGGTASYNLSLASSSYAGTVTFACTGAPLYATCSATPTSTSIAAGANATVKITVTTSSTSSAKLEIPGRGQAALAGMGWLLLPVVPLLLLLRRRAIHAQLLIVLAGALIGIVTGCGGGNGGGNTTPPPVTHATPTGTYSLTVTATAEATTSTQSLTLIVQ